MLLRELDKAVEQLERGGRLARGRDQKDRKRCKAQFSHEKSPPPFDAVWVNKFLSG
jgi:hypothetical protein